MVTFLHSFMKTGSKLCPLEISHVFISKICPYDLVFDLARPNFGPGIEFIEIKILAKFHHDCIKIVPSEVCTCIF